MIKTLSVDRFKSIRSLSLECRKVNVFIGAPDTGKTNILEALYLLSRLGWNWPLDMSLRVRQELGFDALFYRQFFDQPFQILLRMSSPLPFAHDTQEMSLRATIAGPNRHLHIACAPSGRTFEVPFGGQYHVPEFDMIRAYSYTRSEDWQYTAHFLHGDSLITTPHGANLLYIARHNQRVYELLKETVSIRNLPGLDWRLRFDPTHKAFRLLEVRRDEVLDYNLDLLSDSLKRYFFYGAILLTSENATLVFDEPDVYAFPPYPKRLAEMIAADLTNQFFVTTHNPYLLSGLLEKTPTHDLALFVCYRDTEGSTVAKLLTPDEVSKVIEESANIFFNLDDFIAS